MRSIAEQIKQLADTEKRLEAQGWSYHTVCDSRRVRSRLMTRLEDPDSHRFHLHGKANAPAVIEYHKATHIRIREEWRFQVLHRENGPARMLRDRLTGNVVKEEWFICGQHHRTEGPAVAKYDRVTGATIYEAFWENGKRLLERSYPENDTHPTPRQVARRNRRPPNAPRYHTKTSNPASCGG
jgi:hypothetical protein